MVSELVIARLLPGTFHAAAAAATPTVLSPTAGMTTFPIHGTVTQPTVFSPNALQPFAGSHPLVAISVTCLLILTFGLVSVYMLCYEKRND